MLRSIAVPRAQHAVLTGYTRWPVAGSITASSSGLAGASGSPVMVASRSSHDSVSNACNAPPLSTNQPSGGLHAGGRYEQPELGKQWHAKSIWGVGQLSLCRYLRLTPVVPSRVGTIRHPPVRPHRGVRCECGHEGHASRVEVSAAAINAEAPPTQVPSRRLRDSSMYV